MAFEFFRMAGRLFWRRGVPSLQLMPSLQSQRMAHHEVQLSGSLRDKIHPKLGTLCVPKSTMLIMFAEVFFLRMVVVQIYSL